MANGVEVYPYIRRTGRSGKKKPGNKNEFSLRKHAQLLPAELLRTLLGFVLGQAVLLGITPFGYGYFAYLLYRNKRLPWLTLAGVVLGQYVSVGWYKALASLLSLLILSLISSRLGRDRIVFASMVIFVTVPSMVQMLDQSLLYNFLQIGLSAIIASGLVYFSTRETQFAFGSAFWAMGLLLGVDKFFPLDLSMQHLLSCLMVLYAAQTKGIGAGALVGTVVGIVPSLGGSIAPLEVGYQALAGTLAGAFRGNRWTVVLGFLAARLFVASYLSSSLAVIVELKEAVVAIVIFLLTPGNALELFAAYLPPLTEEFTAGTPGKYYSPRLRKLASILDGIASSLRKGFQDNTGELEIAELLNKLTRQVCSNCARFSLCWEKDSNGTYREILQLFSLLDTVERVEVTHISGILEGRCASKTELVTAVNCLGENYLEQRQLEGRMDSERELLREQLQIYSRTLLRTANQMGAAVEFDQLTQKSLELALARRYDDVRVEGVRINGKGQVVLIGGPGCSGEMSCSYQIRPLAEQVLGQRVGIQIIDCNYETGTGGCHYELVPATPLTLKTGIATLPKQGNTVSGDNHLAFSLDGKVQLLAISDGMGSGVRAFRDSQYTLQLIRQFLEIGSSMELALKSTNDILTLKFGEDIFCTADVFSVDLETGEAVICKAGAQPGYLVSGGEVHRLKSGQLPLGIFSEWKPEIDRKTLREGDLMVMVSDGIVEVRKGQEPWLENLLLCWEGDNPQELADAVLQCAVGGKDCRDDLTVVIGQLELGGS